MHRLNTRISISKHTKGGTNENGFPIEDSWNDEYYHCWSEYRNIKGKEFIAAKATNSQSIVTFTVRYCNKTSPLLIVGNSKLYRVIYDNIPYNVVFASDYENRHKYIDLKCEVIS
ncbi:MAG: phage head closure protein [Clostridium sp.]|uniref:phage head closure protein n=1 Tax=Clostridium sp. TaxID=1506 RepID=UPI003F2A4662